jgi:hypothetical protein
MIEFLPNCMGLKELIHELGSRGLDAQQYSKENVFVKFIEKYIPTDATNPPFPKRYFSSYLSEPDKKVVECFKAAEGYVPDLLR